MKDRLNVNLKNTTVMIVPSMTKAEVLKELSRDVDYIAQMQSGLRKKYARQLKNKCDGLLGITRYVNPQTHNIQYVVWHKVFNGYYCDISHISFIEYNDGRNINYLMPSFTNLGYTLSGCVVFTAHSIQRLYERAGLSWIDFLKEGYKEGFRFGYQYYDYKGVKTLSTSFGLKGIFIVEEGKWGIVMKTFVSNNLLGTNQQTVMVDCRQANINYTKEIHAGIERSCGDRVSELSRTQRRAAMRML